ncbi:hypothetical protein Asru_0238_09 [Acidisphaera rubrifaciens HS-AP3]|uniref:Uncharacterized protein n=1 Tax=Acidisphaera rubrifaciens HS-AP3 TaxID=1231350 RepID=A0A0D6P7E4_9PROT|nr:hypothetical protein Asru_0238_09 [Acidisphaera rubrifaciens HS-AP3]
MGGLPERPAGQRQGTRLCRFRRNRTQAAADRAAASWNGIANTPAAPGPDPLGWHLLGFSLPRQQRHMSCRRKPFATARADTRLGCVCRPSVSSSNASRSADTTAVAETPDGRPGVRGGIPKHGKTKVTDDAKTAAYPLIRWGQL